MKKEVKIDIIQGQTQSDIINSLDKEKIKWRTSREICDLMGLPTDVNISKKLRKLFDYDIIDRKRNKEVKWGNEFKYKLKKK